MGTCENFCRHSVGSGPDLDSQGLTPQIFWQHQDQLLSATRGTLPEVVKTLVASSPHRQHEDWLKPPTPISKVGGRLLICAITDVPSGLPPHLPNSDDRIAYVIVTNEPTAFDDAVGKDEFERKDVLVLSMQEGKRGQAQFLQTVLPRAVPFIGTYIMGGTKVCICCHNGKDASVGVALAVLQMYFDDDGRILAVKQQEDLCECHTYVVIAGPSHTCLLRSACEQTVDRHSPAVDHFKST